MTTWAAYMTVILKSPLLGIMNSCYSERMSTIAREHCNKKKVMNNLYEHWFVSHLENKSQYLLSQNIQMQKYFSIREFNSLKDKNKFIATEFCIFPDKSLTINSLRICYLRSSIIWILNLFNKTNTKWQFVWTNSLSVWK